MPRIQESAARQILSTVNPTAGAPAPVAPAAASTPAAGAGPLPESSFTLASPDQEPARRDPEAEAVQMREAARARRREGSSMLGDRVRDALRSDTLGQAAGNLLTLGAWGAKEAADNGMVVPLLKAAGKALIESVVKAPEHFAAPDPWQKKTANGGHVDSGVGVNRRIVVDCMSAEFKPRDGETARIHVHKAADGGLDIDLDGEPVHVSRDELRAADTLNLFGSSRCKNEIVVDPDVTIDCQIVGGPKDDVLQGGGGSDLIITNSVSTPAGDPAPPPAHDRVNGGAGQNLVDPDDAADGEWRYRRR
jgi:hypothetical protein